MVRYRIAPLDVTEAVATGLFNLGALAWDRQLLSVVTGSAGVDKLLQQLGNVQLNDRESSGVIGSHLVNQFGFSRNCTVVGFTTAVGASALACPLGRDLAVAAIPSAMVCLGVEDDDVVVVPVTKMVLGLEWSVTPHPARDRSRLGSEKNQIEPTYLVTIE